MRRLPTAEAQRAEPPEISVIRVRRMVPAAPPGEDEDEADDVRHHRATGSTLLAIAGRRVQLIEGQLIEMPPLTTPHIGAMHYLFQTLAAQVGQRVFSQTPITISRSVEPDWEPQPDVYVALPGASLKPPIEQLELIIEVTDNTFRNDRARKMKRYHEVGNAEVWLVDLGRRPGGQQQIEVWQPAQQTKNIWVREAFRRRVGRWRLLDPVGRTTSQRWR
jgi:Uma2 family endonuclease